LKLGANLLDSILLSKKSPSYFCLAFAAFVCNFWFVECEACCRFDQCAISPLSLKAVKDAGYERMTEVQEATLPIILQGQLECKCYFLNIVTLKSWDVVKVTFQCFVSM
jgi:hypothetical protein